MQFALAFAVKDLPGLPVCVPLEASRRSQIHRFTEPAFRNLNNHFPHLTLDNCRATIPLSLVYVFCSVAQRLGIDAGPVNFPGRVMAHIKVPHLNSADFYVDVFASETKAVLTLHGDLQPLFDTFLGNVDIEPSSAARFLERAPISPMLRRSRRNIYASINSENLHSTPVMCALYATSVIGGLFEPGANDPPATLVLVGRRATLDVEAVMLDTLVPLIQPAIRDIVERECISVSEAEVSNFYSRHRRSAHSATIGWSVGTVFRHKRFNDIACIIGWSVSDLRDRLLYCAKF